MVMKAGEYSGPPFQGQCGVTQGNPFYPTVFNVVVDAMIRYWVMVVELTEAETERLREIIQELASFF